MKQPINQYIVHINQDINLARVTDVTTKVHLLLLGLPKTTRAQLKLGGTPTCTQEHSTV